MNMHQNKLVAVIKHAGKVLREKGDTVTLPFGSEFSILIKNLNSVKAQVRVSIDGTDATELVWLIVNPNSSIELERFIKNGNLQKGNKFKFIEKTSAVEQFRGNKAEDGLIRIEYQFEQPRPTYTTTYNQIINTPSYPTWPSNWPNYPSYPNNPVWGNAQTTFGINNGTANANNNSKPILSKFAGVHANQASILRSASTASLTMSETSVRNSSNTEGITVPGSVSNQTFTSTAGFVTDGQTHTLVLKLVGTNFKGEAIAEPLTVKTKLTCTTCGMSNSATRNFCSQ